MEENQEICSVCHQVVKKEYYFCPNCGNNLKESLMPISVLTQIGLYAFAIFLPPLGLWPGAKYMMKKNPNARKIGITTIVLTLISTVITAWAIFALFSDYIGQMNDVLYGM